MQQIWPRLGQDNADTVVVPLGQVEVTHLPLSAAQERPASEHWPVDVLHLLLATVRVEEVQRLLAQAGTL